ncbi:MAG: hypothetical protein H0W72_14420, partial [Planctomycetes bacterium]|nr:hypothetical protein [Planctomycetota bacterium]
PSYGDVTVANTWHANQVKGTMAALGFYGAMDYLPANTIWAYYQRYGGVDMTSPAPGGPLGGFYERTSRGGWPLWMIRAMGSSWSATLEDLHFCDRNDVHGDSKGSGHHLPRGTFELTRGGTYAIPNPNYAGTSAQGRYRFTRYEFASADVATENSSHARVVVNNTAAYRPLLVQKPVSWPGVDVTVSRLLAYGRRVNVCRVQRISPSTGEMVELSFTGLGTTLQGARCQRTPTPNGGWAPWDNAASFTPGPTMDTY